MNKPIKEMMERVDKDITCILNKVWIKIEDQKRNIIFSEEKIKLKYNSKILEG